MSVCLRLFYYRIWELGHPLCVETFLDRNVSHVGFTLEKKKKASRVKAY